MLKFLYRQKRKKGFTLIELVVVIAIIAVLLAIVGTTLIQYYQRARISSANATASTIRRAVEAFMLDLNLKGIGMKRGSHINAQVMFMVKNGRWMVKTECKVNGAQDPDGHLTFNDHTNWWKNNATALMLDTTTRYDPNHQLALCRAVADCCESLKTGFIMCFFTDGACKGVVYIPECDYLWPGNYPNMPSELISGRQKVRPRLVRSLRVEGAPALKEFSPWAGKWPLYAGEDIWSGMAGIDKDGFYVGTYPVIDLE